MSTTQNLTVQKQQLTGVKSLSNFLNSDAIKKKFQDILGEGGPAFVSSILTIINQNNQLQNADQNSIYTAALMAASLKLPINQNLGLAYIIPYKDKNKGQVAQFQIGYKGFLQLAQRSGLYKIINSESVKEGEIVEFDRLSGSIKFNWEQDYTKRLKMKTVGYVSYFKLENGFESTLYMSVEELTAHGKKYSQTFKNGFGLWTDDFDSMARKTVTKLNISKNGPLSIDVQMQKAVIADQAVIKNDSFIDGETIDVETEYIDNKPEVKNAKAISEEKERDRIIDGINNSKSKEELSQFKNLIPEEDFDLYTIYSDKEREFKK